MEYKITDLNNNIIGSSNLTDEFKDELKIDQTIAQFQEKIGEDEILRSMDLDKRLLLRFLHSRQFDVNASFDALTAYVETRKANPHFFCSPSDVRKVFDNNALGLLDDRHPITGEVILYTRVGGWDPSEFTFETFTSALVATLETASLDLQTQVSGIIDIVDMSGFGWRQMKNFGPFQAKLTADLTDKILPIRFNQIHVINVSYLAKMAYQLMKPFMSDDYAKKIHFHGSDLTQLHDIVPRDILPKEIGGTKGAYSSKVWYDKLVATEPTLNDMWYGRKTNITTSRVL